MNAHAAATIRPMVWNVKVPTRGISELPTACVSMNPHFVCLFGDLLRISSSVELHVPFRVRRPIVAVVAHPEQVEEEHHGASIL